MIALNSEIDVRAGSPQEQWLRADLAANRTRCAAYWHKPRFSSGPHGDHPGPRDIWRALYDHNVDVVIAGRDHLYERFARQDPDGRPDAQRGIRQFVAGTGGATLYEHRGARPNNEIQGTDWGVLVLTLSVSSYHWEFVPVVGARFRDAGSDACH